MFLLNVYPTPTVYIVIFPLQKLLQLKLDFLIESITGLPGGAIITFVEEEHPFISVAVIT